MKAINEQQIEQSLKMTEAEITLWEQKHRTWMSKNKFERLTIEGVLNNLGIGGLTNPATCEHAYLEAHKAFQEAEGQLMELQIAKLKSQSAVYKAMLEEARNPSPLIAGPDGGSIKV